MGFLGWVGNQIGNKINGGQGDMQNGMQGGMTTEQQAMYQQQGGYVDPNQMMYQQGGAYQQPQMGNGYVDPNTAAYGNLGPVNPYNGYGDPYGYSGGYGGRMVTKKMLLDYIVGSLGAVEVVQVEDFETQRTRHICRGTREIKILDANVFNVPTPNGMVPVGVMYCPYCRKLIVNRSTLEII